MIIPTSHTETQALLLLSERMAMVELMSNGRKLLENAYRYLYNKDMSPD